METRLCLASDAGSLDLLLTFLVMLIEKVKDLPVHGATSVLLCSVDEVLVADVGALLSLPCFFLNFLTPDVKILLGDSKLAVKILLQAAGFS